MAPRLCTCTHAAARLALPYSSPYPAAPMLDSLATGLRECKGKELVGSCLAMDSFFDAMLRSRISRRVIAEQHLHINNKRWEGEQGDGGGGAGAGGCKGRKERGTGAPAGVGATAAGGAGAGLLG